MGNIHLRSRLRDTGSSVLQMSSYKYNSTGAGIPGPALVDPSTNTTNTTLLSTISTRNYVSGGTPTISIWHPARVDFDLTQSASV